MDKFYEEQNKYIASVMESTPENRKEWNLDEWIEAMQWHSGLIYENDCPIDSFSPEHWKEIIISGTGCEAQFCPCPDKVLALLDKSDFSSCSSYNICMCLALEGEWLAPLLPLENIEQEDFDNILVCDPDEYKSEDEFLELVGARFPDRVIPPHLNYPHKGENRK